MDAAVDDVDAVLDVSGETTVVTVETGAAVEREADARALGSVDGSQAMSPTAASRLNRDRRIDITVVVAVSVSSNLHADTQVVHAGREIDPHTGAVTPAIEMSTTFARSDDGELMGDHLYGRYGNPTRERLERCLASLEGAADAMCVASGCATAHVLLSTLEQGDGVVVGEDMYFGIRSLLTTLSARWGIGLSTVDTSDLAAVDRALSERPKLLMCETPTNPMMQLADIRQLATRCNAAGTALVVDNTMATPLLQQPLDLGADLVMHSTTKYLAGHSDIIGGAILTRDASHPTWQRALQIRKVGGAVPSPFDCWLLLRSIGTLSVRVERQVDNADSLARFLAEHPAVDAVLYPGLPDHPGHAIAERQMRRPGAMLSLLLAGGEAAARRFMARLQLWVRATSLGGIHSLAEHRAVVEGPDTTTPRNLVRLSVGIEDADDLREDLAQALSS